MDILVTPPADEPLSVAELKAALRIDCSEQDLVLADMARTARTFLERRLDRAFLRQSWRHVHEGFPTSPIALRPGPNVTVTSVVLFADNGSRETLDGAEWRLSGSAPVNFCLIGRTSGPGISRIEITFDAGAERADDIPADLLRAIYLLTAHYYEERELFRSERYIPVPHNVDALISPYREVRL